jgi:hypothetical protein
MILFDTFELSKIRPFDVTINNFAQPKLLNQYKEERLCSSPSAAREALLFCPLLT